MDGNGTIAYFTRAKTRSFTVNMSVACMQEMIVYTMFTLFFFGAGINCAVAAAHFNRYYNTYYHYEYYYGSAYPSAIVAAVTIILFLLFSVFFNHVYICSKAGTSTSHRSCESFTGFGPESVSTSN